MERLLFLPVSFRGGNLNPRTTPIVKGSWRMWYDLAACPGTRGGEFDELLASFPWKREEKEKMGVDADRGGDSVVNGGKHFLLVGIW